jgi:DMSO/TMAO reductase YedYZ heme-binding membrane subunit
MAMSSNQRTATTFIGATALTSIAAAAYMAIAGADDESIRLALRVSGRIAFAVLIVVFAARPLQQLLKAPWTAKLLRNRKLLGVAFAGIHTAHLGLILMRMNQLPDFSVSFEKNYLGMFVYAVIFAMLITSFDGPARALGKKKWKALHKVGLFILVAAFTDSQRPQSMDQLELINGLLIAMAAVALAIRIAAFLANRKKSKL